MLAADFHVHAFVGDGGVPPIKDWPRGPASRVWDVIVVSNHNQLLAARLSRYGTRLYGSEQNALIIPAEELTAPGFHMIAAGITRTIDWRLPAAQAIAAIHDWGEMAVAPGPGTPVLAGLRQRGESASRWRGSGAPGGAAKPEAGPSSGLFRRPEAINRSLAAIGSSDFHFGEGAPRRVPDDGLLADEFAVDGVIEALCAVESPVACNQNRRADWQSGPRRDRPPPAGRRPAGTAPALAMAHCPGICQCPWSPDSSALEIKTWPQFPLAYITIRVVDFRTSLPFRRRRSVPPPAIPSFLGNLGDQASW